MEKPIVGFEGCYVVTSDGRIFSVRNGKYRERKLAMDRGGYLVVSLWANNKNKQFKVHRLVAEAFIPNLKNKRCVNHKDGDKQNNSISNLEWVTHGENKHHAFSVLGERHWMKDKHGALCIHHKVVEQIDPNTQEVIAVYNGAQEAYRLTGFSQGNISSVCRGQRKIANGFIWRYRNDTCKMG
jgi:hypothetical protein